MAPSAIAEHPVKDDVIVRKLIEFLPLPSPDAKGKVRAFEDHREIKPAFKFTQAFLLDENRFKTGSRAWKLAVSILSRGGLTTMPILFSGWSTDIMKKKRSCSTRLV